MKRYPHTAIIRTASEKEQDGQLVTATPLELEIKGRMNYNGKPVVMRLPDGDEVQVSKQFITGKTTYDDAVELVFGSDTYTIVKWLPYQLHSIIYLK